MLRRETQQKGWEPGVPGKGGGKFGPQKQNVLKECMKLNWNFQGVVGVQTKQPWGVGGMDILFWNKHTVNSLKADTTVRRTPL